MKNHFYKLSKKNKNGTTNTVLPVVRNVDITSKITDASHTADTSRRSVESIRNVEPAKQKIISCSMEPLQSRIMSSSSNNGKSMHSVDPSRGKDTPKNMSFTESTKIIQNGAVDSQIPNVSRSTIADISRNSEISRMTDQFHVNNLSRDTEMPRNEDLVYSTDLSRNIREIGRSGEFVGKNIDITSGKCKY